MKQSILIDYPKESPQSSVISHESSIASHKQHSPSLPFRAIG
ncbi:hypothetical protein [Microcoleus sp. LEGE 07076]|nr:hypothetical protein [Microcoleus sp. LEGE 07076]